MSLVKAINPASWNYDGPVVQHVKLSSHGLYGADRIIFEKRASSDLLRDLDAIREKVASDEELIHLLAMGATEFYGANRNGDGFRCDVCRNYHPTFVKHARFYRNHQNKDPRKSYGRIVKSAFNEQMKRVELLVALNASQSAADRNGGLVAKDEMEKLAAGRDIPVSMACLVPYDVCSYCENRAPRRDDYCSGIHEGGHCKAGGLKNNIGSLVEIDGGVHQLHADNTLPRFFDISNVFRPADRIAYALGSLEKAAADRGQQIIKSADLAAALGIMVPCELLINNHMAPRVQHTLKVAHALATIEEAIEAGQHRIARTYAAACDSRVQASPVSSPPLFREKFAMALRALADQRICLPIAQFVELTTGQSTEKSAEIAVVVARDLPGIFTRLASDTQLTERLAESSYTPSDCVAPPQFAAWAAKHAGDLSFSPKHVHSRLTRAALCQVEPGLRKVVGHEKLAAGTDPARKMAEEYALYKLAFVAALPQNDSEFQLTASLAVMQNYTS